MIENRKVLTTSDLDGFDKVNAAHFIKYYSFMMVGLLFPAEANYPLGHCI